MDNIAITNGIPHHHPWSIGKRLLSSWLPVRSAKASRGKGHTHIVRWRGQGQTGQVVILATTTLGLSLSPHWTLSNWNIKDFVIVEIKLNFNMDVDGYFPLG